MPSDNETTEDERDHVEITQQMPETLLEDIDSFAEQHELARDTAINTLIRDGLMQYTDS
jgi:metal-responsive CopG/Arc/MetJ family transcriptional regulator